MEPVQMPLPVGHPQPCPSRCALCPFQLCCCWVQQKRHVWFVLANLPAYSTCPATRFLFRGHTIKRKKEGSTFHRYVVLKHFQEMRLIFPQIRSNELLTEAELCCLLSFLLLCTQNLSLIPLFSLCVMFSEWKIHIHKVKQSWNKTYLHFYVITYFNLSDSITLHQ